MKNLPIATVYDLEKAFDSVDRTLLLSKLINSGLNGPMLATIKSFLSNRKVSIQVNDFIDMSFVPPKGFRTFRHKTFRQQDGGRRFGNFLLPKRLWCRNVFTAGERRFGNKFSVLSPSTVGAYSMYARSPSPSQRPAPTTIASRSSFPLVVEAGLCDGEGERP